MEETRDVIDDRLPLIRGADAIRELVAARRAADPGSFETVEQWWSAETNVLRGLSRPRAAVNGTPITLRQRTVLYFLLADSLAVSAIEKSDLELLREACVSFIIATLFVGRAGHLSPGQRFAALCLGERIAGSISIPSFYRSDLNRKLEELSEMKVEPDWREFLSEAMTESQAMALASDIRRAVTAPPPVSIPAPSASGEVLSSADLLARAAGQQAAEATGEQAPEVEYDLSDADVRLRSILLSGFRGSPSELSMTFTAGEATRSVLLFGENGVGKSTIVDAIEFALQGRIGRSSYFDSPLLPFVLHIARRENASTTAALSDGSAIERSAIFSEGRVIVNPRTVRPGFRLAPITIKRSDILRFLDTEALERGSALLDYFPADAEHLAIRPDEEAHRLEAEIAELRIRRSMLAQEVSEILSIPASELGYSDKFNRAVRKRIMGGETKGSFEARNGWAEVPPSLRDQVGQLANVHQRLSQAKKRMDQTTQIFNPIAHQRQLIILKSILEDIGTDLSAAFIQLAGEYPIEKIDVVFGASGPLSLDIVVRLKGGLNSFPQQIFSEAYQDLLALLFFTSVAKEASKRGQARILILDDVLQSVDAKIRHSFVDYVLSEFSDWQLIFTTHDRLWLGQLRDLFDAHEHPCVERRIYNWDFDNGPRLAAVSDDSLTRDLLAALQSGEPRTIGVLAGQLLEVISDQVTKRMHLSVTRTANDQYTLGDLWPAVRERLSGTRVGEYIRRIASHRHLRNLTSHADSLSWGLSSRDATDFAAAVLALYAGVKCSKCGGWLRQRDSNWQCSCGSIRL